MINDSELKIFSTDIIHNQNLPREAEGTNQLKSSASDSQQKLLQLKVQLRFACYKLQPSLISQTVS